ncbi:proton channel OTOP3-like [Leptodactylus fuscus]|uniref:proton channel OTOP3-like n=1 Tax=Leptodactylus fuscus TaxID=238119 RepID=UPI003F4E9330
MALKEHNQPITNESFGINYEQSWLHRHCPSPLIHHKRARGSGRLFSGLMALNVVFLGAALVSSVVLSSMPAKNSYIYLSILMLASSVWAIYYLVWTRRIHIALLQDHHAGSLWLKVSLVLFGSCSLLVSAFKIGYDTSLFTCKMPVDIFFSVTKIIFIVIQTALLWVSCRDCIQVQHNITRYGIMLAVATNLLLWLLAVLNDSVHRETENLKPNSTLDNGEDSKCSCPKYSTCWTFQRGYVTIYPFNLEYSLICASMLFIMWRNVGRREIHLSELSHPTFRLQGVLYGPVLGTAAVIVGICIFILYQIQASSETVDSTTFILYFMFSIILLGIMVISCFIGIIAQSFRDKRYLEHSRHDSEDGEDPDKQSREMRPKESNECRHRNVEKNKDHGESQGEAEEHKESNGIQNNNFEDHEHSEYHTVIEEEKYDVNEKPPENEKHNGRTEKEHKEVHMDHKNHHTRRRFSTEKNTHQQENILHKVPPKNYIRSLEITLLLGAALGQFSISYYSMVAIVATGSWTLLNSLNLTYSILMILQHMVQNVFIIEGMRKEQREHFYLQASKENKEEHDEGPRRLSVFEIRRASVAYLQSVGRLSLSRRLVKEMALFLVFCNIMLWIMSAFGDHPLSANGLETEYYGFSVWFSILNFGLPLSVFYRMHSVGGLLEVYVTA